MHTTFLKFKIGEQQQTNPYQRIGTTQNQSYSELWTKYYASKPSTNNNPQNLHDAIAKLNAKNNMPQATNGIMKENPLNTNNIQKNEKISDKKLIKSRNKLLKLSKALRKSNFPKVIKKHQQAIDLIKINPALSHLEDIFNEKFLEATDGLAALIEKSETALTNTDTTASSFEGLINSIQNEYEKLQNNWKLFSTGFIKIGTYSEAMLRTDNEKLKNKYEKEAQKIAAEFPDFKVDKSGIQQATIQNTENNENETENFDIANNDNENFPEFSSNQIPSTIEGNTTLDEQNQGIPSESNSNMIEIGTYNQEDLSQPEKTHEDNSKSEISLNETNSKDLEESKEVDKIKSEILEDFKKNNIKKPDNTDIKIQVPEGTKIIKSLLYE